MKSFFVFLILIAMTISGCGKKDDVIKLEKESTAYQLAKDLSNKLSFLDPDSNNILISTKKFDVSVGEVLQSIYNTSGSRSNQLKSFDPNRLKGIILQNAERMAEQKLVLNDAKAAKFSLSEALFDSILQQQYAQAGGEQQFLEMLKMSEVSIENVKTEIHKNVLLNEFLDEKIGNQILVSDEDVQKAYNDYVSNEIATVRHILLLTQGKSEAEKKEIRKKIEDILKQAKNGADFAELAQKYSEDPGSKDKGGLYENFGRGTMVKPFEDAAFSVPIGELSDVIETVYGFHILKVVDRNNFQSLEVKRPELEAKLKESKKPELYRTYITNLKEQAEYKVIAH
ncbi:peptidylprolyl isomerase [candidate division KSB1 bacterium]|nr:peptidylprolyl isomerase [candidate division KSB1 bacterium]